MDYTTLTNVKTALGAAETTDDTALARFITAASRAIDQHCGAVADYFESETVTSEQLLGQIDADGRLVCWPMKPVITAVTAFSYRQLPYQSWLAVDLSYVTIDRGCVLAWLSLSGRQQQMVQISYSGGLAASVANLPADLVEAATVLAARYYREARTGLTDSIGVAELGTLIYTRALPVRVVDMLKPYKRVVPL